MKVKVLKPHYHEYIYRSPGDIYRADENHIDMVVRRGLCERVERPQKKNLAKTLEIEDKVAPVTKKRRTKAKK